MKTVSIVIPVSGVEKHISAAVRSVLEQTYKNFELIIVDNGSSERTLEVCQQFKDSRIKIIRQPNRGASVLRNIGLRHAQGEYVAFLEGDDVWLPEKLEKHVEHLDNSPNVGVSFCASGFIDEADKLLGIYTASQLKGITAASILSRNPLGKSSVGVFRREVFEGIKFQANLQGAVEDCYFDEQLRSLEDVECLLRMVVQTNWQIEGISEVLTLCRVEEKDSSRNASKHLEALEQLIEKARSYAPGLSWWAKLNVNCLILDYSHFTLAPATASLSVAGKPSIEDDTVSSKKQLRSKFPFASWLAPVFG